MKNKSIIILSIIFVILSVNPLYAKWRTYTVVEVNNDTIFLQTTSGRITASIEKSRRPSLQVGDKVRYDKERNRLGSKVEK